MDIVFHVALRVDDEAVPLVRPAVRVAAVALVLLLVGVVCHDVIAVVGPLGVQRGKLGCEFGSERRGLLGYGPIWVVDGDDVLVG